MHLGLIPEVLGFEQRPGDLWILDPYRGGTHLPDVTLISPLHADGRLIGFAASRAHHADIGGPTPGGMPADSTTLDQEVVITPTGPTTRFCVGSPSRCDGPGTAREHLRAQRAANLIGARRRRAARSPRRRRARERHARDPRLLRAPPARWPTSRPDGEYTAEDVLEGGPGGALDLTLRVQATNRRRLAAPRLRGHGAPGRGQPQLPRCRSPSRRPLHHARAHRSRRPSLTGAPPPGRGRRPAGCLLNAHPHSRPWPATSRRRAEWPTS